MSRTNKTRSLLLLLILAWLFSPVVWSNSDRAAAVTATVNEHANALLAESDLNALSVGIYWQEQNYTAHFGELDPGVGNAPNDQTIYEIASVTKTFTGTLVAQAVLDGKLTLDDDIRSYLPDGYDNLAFDQQPIRIKHLITHTSGLPANNKPLEQLSSNNDDGLLWQRMHEAESAYSKDRFFEDLKTVKLHATPGTDFRYSNLGTNLTAHILEKAYGRRFETLLQAYVFSPAGLSQTSLHLNEQQRPFLANGYNQQQQQIPPLPLASTLWGAEGGLKSTLPDMVNYLKFQVKRTHPAVLESHQRLHRLDTGYWMGYFWWAINVDDDAISYRHDGGSSGVRNVLIAYPQDDLGIYVVTNKASPATFAELSDLVESIRSGLLALAQQPPEPKPSSRASHSKQAYLEDFDELVSRLLDRHPQPYAFISETEFQKQVAATRQSISADTSLRDFIWMLSATIASVGCGHTTLGYFNQEDALLPDSLRLPVDARYVDGRLYVIDPLINADLVQTGDQLLSINGVDASKVRAQIHRHISADAHIATAKDILLNAYLNAYVAYQLDTPTGYTVVTKSSPTPLQLQPLKTYQYSPLRDPNDPCQENLCFRWLDSHDSALLTIRSFAYYGDKFPVFEAFINQTFAQMAEERAKYLVIDVRGNAGGSGAASAYLLQHITPRSFAFYAKDSAGNEALKRPQAPAANRFRGDIYVLADGGSQSSSGHFLSLAKSGQLATIIGEEAGATYTVNDNAERFEATNTGIRYKIARTQFFTTAEGLPIDQGVLPDHQVRASIEGILDGRDTVLDAARKLIRTNGAERDPSIPVQ